MTTNFDVIIEIPSNERHVKYEFDPAAKRMRVDRFFTTAMSYPGNYGYIEGTMAGDGDPLDVLVLGRSLKQGCVVNCRALGALETTDEKGQDEKIIAVASTDGRVHKINDSEISMIRHFFKHYKDNEKGKFVKVGEFVSVEEALTIIENSKVKKKRTSD